MQKWYKEQIAKHHKKWDTLTNDGKTKEADKEMKKHNNYLDLLQVAIRNNLH